jgi:regulator of protease activity HflC (stomatin/prohibitin superfamily)
MSIDLPVGFIFYVCIAVLLLLWLGMLAVKVLARFKPELADRILRRRFSMALSSLVLVLLAFLILPYVLIPIKPGQVGVIWERFNGGTRVDEPCIVEPEADGSCENGKRVAKPFGEGTALVMPWDRLIIYSSRFQTFELPIEAVTSEGLKITLNTVVRYRPVRDNIALLHKVVGEDYAKVLIIPEVGSSTRLIVSGFTAEHIYANKREFIQKEIFNHVNRDLKLNQHKLLMEENVKHKSEFIYLEDIMIRDVGLPAKVHTAIINKVNQNYLNAEYDIRLLVADKEALRKEKEAQGIAAFQATVSGGISETYLRWRGIEATVELAKSNNAKVVVIGGGKDGLPLILNTDGAMSAAAPVNSGVEDKNKGNEPAVEINANTYEP